MLTMLLALLAQTAPPLVGHHARVDGARISWTTTMVGPQHAGARWALVDPLPSTFAVEGASELRAVRDEAERVVAFELREPVGSVSLTIVGPRAPLHAPILRGVQQRVTVAPPARLAPARAMGLEPHVGYATSAALEEDDRDRLDAALRWVAPDPPPGSLYVAGATPLVAELVDSPTSGGVAWIVGLAFVALTAGLAAAHRGLARRAERERSDAVLRAELDALGVSPQASDPG